MVVALDPWLSFWRGRLTRAVRSVSQLGRGNRQLEVQVLSGLHAGTCVTAEEAIVVGSAPDDDVMLLDDDMDGRALALIHQTSPLGGFVSIDARDEAECSGAGTALTVDARPLQDEIYRLPCRLHVGEVELALAEVPVAARKVGSAPAAGFALLALAVVGAGVGAATIGPAAEEVDGREVVLAGTTGAAQSITQPSEARNWLNAEIGEAGLNADLTLTESGDPLRVTGTLSPDEHQRWSAVHRAFDDRFPDTGLIVRVDLRAARPDLPAIAAARLRPDPAVILADGRHLAPGDQITPDWTIADITATGFELRRGPETLTVEF